MIWKTVKLDEIVNLSIGKTPSRGNVKFWDKEKLSKNIWLSIADLSALGGLYIEDSKEYVSDEGAKLFKTVPSETLLMSFKLSIGKLAITKCELRTNEAIAALPIKDEKLITKEYLYYFLSSINWDALAANDVKVKGKTLNKAKLKEILISYPPLAEQKRIVAKLDRAFEEIDKAVNLIKNSFKNIECFAESLIETLIYKSSNNFKELEIRDLGSVQTGSTPKTSQKNLYGNYIPFVKPPHFNKNGTLKISNNGLSKEGLKKSRLIASGSILMVCIGATIGKVAFTEQNVTCNQQINCVTPEQNYNKDFIFWQMKSKRFKQKVISFAGQSTLPIINKSKWEKLKILIPNSLKKQKEIAEKLNKTNFLLIKILKLYQVKLDKLNCLKSSILKHELQQENVA